MLLFNLCALGGNKARDFVAPSSIAAHHDDGDSLGNVHPICKKERNASQPKKRTPTTKPTKNKTNLPKHW